MKPNEIKALLAKREITLVQIAAAVGERPPVISQTVNYLRQNDRVRQKIADFLGIPLKKLFSEKIPVAPARFREMARRTAA